MKTLDQIEARTPISSVPFTISASGSYYLANNITVPSGTNSIVIVAPARHVTLDLNGFVLSGSGTGDGITISENLTNVTIRNGVIRNWNNGIVSGTNVSHVRVEEVRTSSNAGTHIDIGASSLVRDCAIDSSGTGIAMETRSVVQNCTLTSLGTALTASGSNCLISHCQISLNNTGLNLASSSGTMIVGCEIANNAVTAITLGASSMVRDCLIVSTSTGIDATAGTALIENCLINFTGTSAAINLGSNSTVRDCAISLGGTADGINIGSTIVSCLISNNHIRTAPSGHAGIQVSGPNNRIDGNTFTSNATGLNVTGTAGTFITRNMFINNTNAYSASSQQKNAEFLTFTSSNNVSTDPWANIQ